MRNKVKERRARLRKTDHVLRGCEHVVVVIHSDEAVHVVAHHAHNPSERRWKAAIKIMADSDWTSGFGPTSVNDSSLDWAPYRDAR